MVAKKKSGVPPAFFGQAKVSSRIKRKVHLMWFLGERLLEVAPLGVVSNFHLIWPSLCLEVFGTRPRAIALGKFFSFFVFCFLFWSFKPKMEKLSSFWEVFFSAFAFQHQIWCSCGNPPKPKPSQEINKCF